ncbi:MAG: ABC transporter permease, partial [Thermoplasmata archaeon]
KDFEELKGNRYVFVSVFLLPIVFVAEGLFEVASSVGGTRQSILSTTGPVVTLDLVLFLLIPALVSVVIAATGIVLEKTNRSLEPLLATPITDAELMWGKALAPLLPALAVTYAVYAVFFAGVDAIVDPVFRGVYLPDFTAVFIALGLGTLMGLLGTFAALWVSSRMKDVRSAQQFSMLVVIPAFAAIVAVILISSANWILLAGVGVAMLIGVIALVRLVIDRFQRDNILVTWK